MSSSEQLPEEVKKLICLTVRENPFYYIDLVDSPVRAIKADGAVDTSQHSTALAHFFKS